MLYILRRNDKSWNGLSSSDKELVLEANRRHNNERPTYASPQLYKDGQVFDSDQNRQESPEGRYLLAFLQQAQPASVIEVGPGSGFYTKSIVTHPTVKTYIAVDIVQSFLDFLQPHLQELRAGKPGFDFKLLHGDFLGMDLEPVDSIIFLSSVHHIPNRLDLLKWVERSLCPGGHCFIFEPAHYLPRISYLLNKYLRSYYKASHRTQIENFSTHHFCTLEEFEALSKQVSGLHIQSYSFHNMDFPKFARKVLDRVFLWFSMPRDADGGVYAAKRNSFLRFFSQRMFIEFVKD